MEKKLLAVIFLFICNIFLSGKFIRISIIFDINKLHLVANDECKSNSNNSYTKLKSELFCNYDSEIRPQVTTNGNLFYVVRNFDFDDDDTLSLTARFLFSWVDDRLLWDADVYDNITKMQVPMESLWTPKMMLTEKIHETSVVELSELATCEFNECSIIPDGEINCLFVCHQTVHCTGDYTDWPFDKHNCSFSFKVHEDKKDKDFHFELNDADTFLKYQSNNEWNMTVMVARLNDKTESVDFNFEIQRLSEGRFANVCIPYYTLITMNLMILWLKPGSYVRNVLCGVSIYLHFGLMDRIWWQ